MTLIRYNNRFPKFFDDFLGKEMDQWFQNQNSQASRPAVNIKESENSFEVEVAAPGLKKEDFKVAIDQDILTISSVKEQNNEQKDEQGKYTQREFKYQSFKRSFRLPENTINTEKVEARYEHGVLYLTLPKLEEEPKKATRQIEIA